MKKRISIFIISSLFLIPINANAATFDNELNSKIEFGSTIAETVSEKEYTEEINQQILSEIKKDLKKDLNLDEKAEIVLDEKDYTISVVEDKKNPKLLINEVKISNVNIKNSEETVPMKAKSMLTHEYRTYIHKNKIVYKNGGYRYASGQLAGGYKGAKYLYYSPSGGGSYSFGVSVGAPWSPVSISAAFGKGSSSNIGMVLKTTSTSHFNKVQGKKTYRCVPYSIQSRKKGTTKWTTISRGIGTSLYRVEGRCVRV